MCYHSRLPPSTPCFQEIEAPGHVFECPILATDPDDLSALLPYQCLEVPVTLPVPAPESSKQESDKAGKGSKKAGKAEQRLEPEHTVTITHRLFLHVVGWEFCPTCQIHRPPGPHEHHIPASRKHVDEHMAEAPPAKRVEAAQSPGSQPSGSYAASMGMGKLHFG